MALFDGKVAVVIDGGPGTGRTAALLYAQNGVSMIVSDVDAVGRQETVHLVE